VAVIARLLLNPLLGMQALLLVFVFAVFAATWWGGISPDCWRPR
jgi:hypothetical protein